MAATFFAPSELVPVKFVPILIYGPTKCGKSSFVQTFATPLTLDFDNTIHRAYAHKAAFRFDTWQDCVQAQAEGKFANHQTIVVDTLGRCLEKMIPFVLAQNAKNGRGGALNQQGWGVLGRLFLSWLAGIRDIGADIVFTAHESTREPEGGCLFRYPDVPGQMAWKEISRSCDIIGRIGFEGKARYIDFSPSEEQVGGNPAGWERMPLPDLARKPTFGADLLADAKAKMNALCAEQNESVSVIEKWTNRLVNAPAVPVLNGWLAEARQLEPVAVQRQVLTMIGLHGRGRKLSWDKAGDCFSVPTGGKE